MKNLKEIESQFREIATSNNLTGDSTELIIKLLAYNNYESSISARISLLESLPNRAVNENSKIEHAVNNMYSVYRGKNAQLSVKARVTGTLSLKRLQEVYSDKYNKFYYSHLVTDTGETIVGDYDLIYGQTYTLFLIKGEEVLTETLSVDTDNLYLLETVSSNVSEDYILRESIDSSVDLKLTKSFSTHIDSDINPDEESLIMDLTLPSYGVRFYSSGEGFNSSLNYNLTYIPYYNEEINSSLLNRMVIEGVELDYTSLSIESPIERESLKNLLYNLSKRTELQSRVRSNSDVLDQFKSMFSYKIKDCALGGYDYNSDILSIYYIPLLSDTLEGESSKFELTENDKSLYKEKLMYYVTKDIQLLPLYDFSSAIDLFISLELVVDSKIDISEISSYLKDMEYSLGQSFDIDMFRGYVNNLEGIRYSIIEVKDIEGNLISTLNLENNKYFKILDNLTYSYKI